METSAALRARLRIERFIFMVLALVLFAVLIWVVKEGIQPKAITWVKPSSYSTPVVLGDEIAFKMRQKYDGIRIFFLGVADVDAGSIPASAGKEMWEAFHAKLGKNYELIDYTQNPQDIDSDLLENLTLTPKVILLPNSYLFAHRAKLKKLHHSTPIAVIYWNHPQIRPAEMNCENPLPTQWECVLDSTWKSAAAKAKLQGGNWIGFLEQYSSFEYVAYLAKPEQLPAVATATDL